MDAHRSSHHRDTIQKIFSHPASGNIEWREVLSLLEYLGTTAEERNGKFTVTLSDLTPGTHNFTATFLANASFASSSSATLPQVVNKAPTLTSLAVLPNSSTSKQQVSMTAVVSIPAPGAGSPTGVVEFVDTTFSKILGTVPVRAIGGTMAASLLTAVAVVLIRQRLR